MIIARCPACQTVFRARPEQLSAHGGRVRCGHCLKPFNALDNLVGDAQDPASSKIENDADLDAPTAHAEPPTDAPARPSLNPWILEENSPDTVAGSLRNATPIDDAAQASGDKHPSTFERMADRLDFVVPDEFLPSRPTSSEARAPSSDTHTSSFDEIKDDLSRMEGTARLELPVAASADASITHRTDASASLDDGNKASPLDTHERWVEKESARIPSEIDSPGSAVLRRRASQLTKSVTPERPSPETIDAVEDDSPSVVRRYGDTPASPGRRWLMGLAIGILLGTLSAQVAYNFRVEITRNWPQLRPIYLELCAQFGCELPLPRVATAIRITSSSLESDPTEPTRFVLNASIANQARHPLAFPHLELTLTDARDRSIVRRVLGPEEWARAADTSKGLAAGEEIETSLAFSAPDLTNATGYRVYAFYP